MIYQVFGLLFGVLALTHGMGYYGSGGSGFGGNQMGGAQPSAPQPYNFNYQAGGMDGNQFRNEQADASGNVQGTYGYTDSQGLYRKVMYSAGPEGFKATVDTNEPGTASQPENPADVNMMAKQAPAGIQAKYSGASSMGGGFGGAGAGFYSAGHSGAGRAGGMDMGAPQPYSFNYQAGDQYRNEQADASGNVQGSYGYTDSQGLYRKVMYTAGAGGFKATVNTNEPGTDSNPENPADVNMNAQQPPAGIQSKYSASSGGHGSAGAAGVGFYSGGQNGGGLAGGMGMGAPEPYSFNYQAGDQYRSEQADASGNVQGSYGYTDNQGLYRKVMYTAGAGGFKATVNTNEPGTDSNPENPADVNMNAQQPPAGIQAKYSASSGGHGSAGAAGVGFYSGGQNGGGLAGGMGMGAPEPYSFNYQAGDQYRSEQADASGNVQGSYGYTDNQGLYRKVMYTAGAGGFKATVNTNEPGTDSNPENPADVNMNAQQSPAGIQAKYSASSSMGSGQSGFGGAGAGFYSAGQHGAGLGGGMEMAQQPQPYNFNYQTGNQFRNEQADASGNVQGTYGYTDSQGLYRKVMYSAGPEGFKAAVDTNEPGTDSNPENPANVNMMAKQAPAGIQAKYSGQSSGMGGGSSSPFAGIPLSGRPKSIH